MNVQTKKIQQIRTLLGEGNIEKALKELHLCLEGSPFDNDIWMLLIDYNHLKRQVRNGTILSENENVSRNKIHKALLELLKELETPSQQVRSRDTNNSKSSGNDLTLTRLKAEEKIDVDIEQKNGRAKIDDLQAGGSIRINIKQ